jgi:hypothetical protein
MKDETSFTLKNLLHGWIDHIDFLGHLDEIQPCNWLLL